MLKVNNKDTRTTPIITLKQSVKYNRNTNTRCEICSKLISKIPEQRYWLTCVTNFTYLTPCFSVPIVNFELVNAG